MSHAQLYRPAPKWPLVGAFIVAAAIHLSAVALASRRLETFTPPPPVEIFDVSVEDPAAEPIPVPDEPAPVEQTSIMVDPDFVDTPTPPRRLARRPAVLATKPPGPKGESGVINLRAITLNAPRPDYPYEARRRHLTGAGVALVTVDPASGAVGNAWMEQSAGDALLDNSAVSAFKRWRFKKGTAPKVRIPFRFTLAGASF